MNRLLVRAGELALHPAAYGVALFCVVLGLWLVSSTKAHRLEDELAATRLSGDEKLAKAEGFAGEQRAKASRLESEAAALREEIARVRAVFPKARVVETIKWKTASAEIPLPTAPRPAAGPTVVPIEVCSPDTTPTMTISAEGAQARLETRGGLRVVVGDVSVWREAPPPREMLTTLPWEADATEVLVLDEKPKPAPIRWRVGPAVGWTDEGWVYGATVSRRLFGIKRVEASASATVLAGSGQAMAVGSFQLGW